MHTDNHANDQRFWDDRYRENDRIWSGDPNEALVREVADLPPGNALDLGCGEGADAVWLAARGWRVTATDISEVALARAAEHAGGAGVAGLITFEHHDYAHSFPDGRWDLVSAQFLHAYGDFPRVAILRRAAEAVAPGGTLLIGGHGSPGPGQEHDHGHGDLDLPTPAELLASLDLDTSAWEVVRMDEYERVQTFHTGETITRTNNTLRLRRR